MAMDVKRDPKILKRKKIRQALILGVVAIGVVVISVAVSRLRPAAPTVPEGTLWFGTVKRGAMVREVRGAGTLVPEDIQWIPATTSGRVEKIVLRPGATVTPGTVILELSNPDLKQQTNDAELAWKASQAQLANLKSTLATNRLQFQNNVTDAESAYNVALSDLEANWSSRSRGSSQRSRSNRSRPSSIAKRTAGSSTRSSSRSADRHRALAAGAAGSDGEPGPGALRPASPAARRSDRQVRRWRAACSSSVSKWAPQVGPGTNLVRISDPTRLKAEVRISETQTRDLSIGQIAKIDTRSGIVKGHVTRIDPASTGGTVGVDVTLDEPLPTGARPDQSVDGVIELQRLENILYVESPAFGQENSSIQLFKVLPNREAVRTTVKIGVRSVTVRRGAGRSAGRRPRGAVRHVAIRLVRPSTTELTAGPRRAGEVGD